MAKILSAACRMLLRPSMPRSFGARSGRSPPVGWPCRAGAAAGVPPSPPPWRVCSPREARAGAGSGAPPSPPGMSLLSRNHGEIRTPQKEDSCCIIDRQNLGQEASMLNYLKSVMTILTGQRFLRRFVSAAQVRDEDMFWDMNIPIIDLDLATLSSNTYDAALSQITAIYHARAQDKLANQYKGIPCTTEEEGYHIVRLTNGPGSASVLLMIQEINNYMIGFRRKDGSWWHFRCYKMPKQVHASPLVKLSGRYTCFFNKLMTWEDVRLGPGELMESDFRLLKYQERVPSFSVMKAQYKALARMIVMFCEAVRFRSVQKWLSQKMDTYASEVLAPHMQHRLTGWCRISDNIRKDTSDERMGKKKADTPEYYEYRSWEEATKDLLLIHISEKQRREERDKRALEQRKQRWKRAKNGTK